MILLPKIGSILVLRTNAMQHCISRHMTTSATCRLNHDDISSHSTTICLTVRPTQITLFNRVAKYFGRNSP